MLRKHGLLAAAEGGDQAVEPSMSVKTSVTVSWDNSVMCPSPCTAWGDGTPPYSTASPTQLYVQTTIPAPGSHPPPPTSSQAGESFLSQEAASSKCRYSK